MLSRFRLQVSTDATDEIVDRLEAFAPNLVAAGGLVLLGLLAAWLAKMIAVRLIRSWSTRVAQGSGRLLGLGDVQAQLRRTAIDEATAVILGRIIFFLVFVIFLAAATESLDLPVVSAWLLGLANYLPQLLAAALVVLLGALAGGLVRGAVGGAAASADVAYGAALGRAAQIAVIAISVVVAVDQLGLEVDFLQSALMVVAAATLGGAALAFGLGAQGAVGDIIASHYVSRSYAEGHRVRLDGVEGRIVEITSVAVILETDEGRLLIPARRFGEQASLLIEG